MAKKSKKKGTIPLKILIKRAKRLENLIKSRSR